MDFSAEPYNDSSFTYMENGFLYPSNLGCEHPGPLVFPNDSSRRRSFTYMENDFLYPSNLGYDHEHPGPVFPSSLPEFFSGARSQRFNPIAVPTNRPATRAAHRRKASRSTAQDDSEDDDDEEFKPGGSIATTRDSRHETVRKTRIESEQRRRDELREGYARLKETLSTQKASKVCILDCGEFFNSHLEFLY
jgi:hypothetical protein